jgi:SepF-like predicted cell division protein (DUF552 family)
MASLLHSIKRRMPFMGKKDIPTEYVAVFEESIEEMANNPNEPGDASWRRKPYKVKILRVSKAEEMDAVRNVMQSHDLILINISAIKDIEEVRRGISKVKVACGRLGGEIVGLDTKWLMVTSKNIDVKTEI